MSGNAIEFATPFVVYFGDIDDDIWGKTGLGLVQWRPEGCAGQVRLAGCRVDAGVPDLSVGAAKAAGVRSLIIGSPAKAVREVTDDDLRPRMELRDRYARRSLAYLEAGLGVDAE